MKYIFGAVKNNLSSFHSHCVFCTVTNVKMIKIRNLQQDKTKHLLSLKSIL